LAVDKVSAVKKWCSLLPIPREKNVCGVHVCPSVC